MLQNTVFQKGFISTLTTKGQVTIPVEIRKYLQINKNDKVTFVVENTGEVKLTHARYPDIQSLRGTAGSIKKSFKDEDLKKIAYEDRFKEKYEK